MKSVFIVLLSIICAACGQDIYYPSSSAGGQCGSYYPGGNLEGTDADDLYGDAEGDIFPCAVWEGARLDGEDTFINVGNEYLNAKHGLTQTKAMVIFVGAEECTNCRPLGTEIAKNMDQFTDANTLMIGMARVNLNNQSDTYFTPEKAETVMHIDNWPTDLWHTINDEEEFLSKTYNDGPPYVVVINMNTMIIEAVLTGMAPATLVREALDLIANF